MIACDCDYYHTYQCDNNLIEKIKNNIYPRCDLYLRYTQFNEETFKIFCNALSCNTLIENLHIDGIQIGYEYEDDPLSDHYYHFGLFHNDIETFCDAIANNKTINTLIIEQAFIDIDNAYKLKAMFKVNDSIKNLELIDIDIEDTVDRILFDFLKYEVNLDKLLIKNVYINELNNCSNRWYRTNKSIEDYEYNKESGFIFENGKYRLIENV